MKDTNDLDYMYLLINNKKLCNALKKYCFCSGDIDHQGEEIKCETCQTIEKYGVDRDD